MRADPSDPIRNLWNVSITDCSTPNAITVLIVNDPSGDRSNFIDQSLLEVRLNCTDGNAQVGINFDSLALHKEEGSHVMLTHLTQGVQFKASSP